MSLPILMFVYMRAVNPRYIRVLTDTTSGRTAIGVGIPSGGRCVLDSQARQLEVLGPPMPLTVWIASFAVALSLPVFWWSFQSGRELEQHEAVEEPRRPSPADRPRGHPGPDHEPNGSCCPSCGTPAVCGEAFHSNQLAGKHRRSPRTALVYLAASPAIR